MAWLVAAAERDDLAAIRDGSPGLWRDLRRYNPPVQLAVAAAHAVAPRAHAPAEAALIALAPCQSGSPELHRWVRDIDAGGQVRVNPTHTLHAVDNLALSVLSLGLGNHTYGMSLGGAAGSLWTALELVGERLADDASVREVLLFGGDQDVANQASAAAGFALLFAREPAPCEPLGRPVRLVGIERDREAAPAIPHAAAGARRLLAALRAHGAGRFAYRVPPQDADGIDAITAVWELG